MIKNEYEARLIKDIDKLKKMNEIKAEDLQYFRLLYSALEEKEYIIKMALITLSYNLIGNISLEERALFVEGMSSYIELTKIINEAGDDSFGVDQKRVLVLKWAKEDFNTDVVPFMFENGVNAVIDLVEKANMELKKEKVRKLS